MPSDTRAHPVPPAATRPLRHAVLRPHEPIEAVAAHEVPGSFAAGVRDADGELVAVGLIGPDGTSGGWRIRGMATAPAARGRGAGSAVLEALMAHARAAGAARIWCNARTPAQALYERAGLRVVSEPFQIEAIGPHVVMEWREDAAGSWATGATPPTASAPSRSARRPG